MNMYERFAKKYGSLADEEDDDSFEQGMNTEFSDLPDVTDPLFTKVVPGPKDKLEDVNIPKAPKLPSFEDTEEEDDDSFEQGMGTDFPDDMESIPSTYTPVVPKLGKRLSRNQIVKLCDYYFDLATS
jgi:hypothetical protein